MTSVPEGLIDRSLVQPLPVRVNLRGLSQPGTGSPMAVKGQRTEGRCIPC
jgi:hypothetical protein